MSSTELTKVPSKRLRSLVIDPFEDQWGFHGYIADAGDETIVVYSSGNLIISEVYIFSATELFLILYRLRRILGLRKWWKLRMLHRPEIPRMEFIDLAVSRTNSSILYMTGHNTHDLFSINLDRIRMNEMLWTLPFRVRAK